MVSGKAGVAPGTSHSIEGAAVSASSRDQECAAGNCRGRAGLLGELTLDEGWLKLVTMKGPMEVEEEDAREKRAANRETQ